MEPQPQIQPVNPVDSRPFAEPARPLNLQPKRPPLDLRPRPNYNPTQVPDLRPATSGDLRPSANPLDRTNTQGMKEALEPILNNPLNYAPGKAITAPLGAINRSRELHQELSTPDTMETIDVPSIPLPADSFPDQIPTSSTSSLPRDAINQGEMVADAQPASGGPGTVAGALYTLTVTYEVYWNWATQVVTYGPLVGPVTTEALSVSSGAYYKRSTLYKAQNGNWEAVIEATFGDGTVQQRNGRAELTRIDGGTDPAVQPATPPQYAPNPARDPFQDGWMPQVLDLPDLDMPGFSPSPGLDIVPAPTGEIVPYSPPSWTPPEREKYIPPDPYRTPDFPPEPALDNPPGGQPQDDPTKKGALGPPWWQPWEDWHPPDPWTNRKRGNRGEDNPQLPGAPPSSQTPNLVIVPYDGCCPETLRRLGDIQERLKKLEIDVEISSWSCNTSADPPAPTETKNPAKDLTTVLDLIGQEISTIRQQFDICPPTPVEQAQHSEIAKNTATEAQTVWYIPLNPATKQIELIITGELPPSFRLYDTSANGEQQAKFGAISLSCSGVVGGNTANAFHQWAWTRRTGLYIGNRSPQENFLRVFIRAGLSWILYDTGLRE